MARPLSTDAPSFYHKYINLVSADSAAEAVKAHSEDILTFYTNLPLDKADHAYADGKWTIKEVLQHVIDAERVFTYRILRIARNDATPLPGFNENSFVVNSEAGNRSFDSLKQEFSLLRQCSDVFIGTLSQEQLKNMGTASSNPITTNAIAFITYGHLLHHMSILKERYL